MLVVDAMRFPYIDGRPGRAAARIPTRHEHGLFGPAVPALSRRPRRPRRRPARRIDAGYPLRLHRADRRAGVTDHTITWFRRLGPRSSTTPTPARRATNSTTIYHTLGIANDSQQEPWDYFPFNDRDFTSVAELMLVPGCPPGLFTKQFAEFAPSAPRPARASLHWSGRSRPRPRSRRSRSRDRRDSHFATGEQSANAVTPHTFPYLVDKFFYTGASTAADTGRTHGRRARPATAGSRCSSSSRCPAR